MLHRHNRPTDNRWPLTFLVVSERELSSAARARPSPHRADATTPPADAAVNPGLHSSLFLGPATMIEFLLEKKID